MKKITDKNKHFPRLLRSKTTWTEIIQSLKRIKLVVSQRRQFVTSMSITTRFLLRSLRSVNIHLSICECISLYPEYNIKHQEASFKTVILKHKITIK